jgi:hypothetical protein
VLKLQGKVSSSSAGIWFQFIIVLFTNEYFPISVLCFLILRYVINPGYGAYSILSRASDISRDLYVMGEEGLFEDDLVLLLGLCRAIGAWTRLVFALVHEFPIRNRVCARQMLSNLLPHFSSYAPYKFYGSKLFEVQDVLYRISYQLWFPRHRIALKTSMSNI